MYIRNCIFFISIMKNLYVVTVFIMFIETPSTGVSYLWVFDVCRGSVGNPIPWNLWICEGPCYNLCRSLFVNCFGSGYFSYRIAGGLTPVTGAEFFITASESPSTNDKLCATCWDVPWLAAPFVVQSVFCT